ncbi:ImmA/IrrE family metallo-endopeptidase [Paenibacillus daejeonensis]|uniref:ImmA/IrrE family metallo-endopeptidase n=1 Tax=Paenibacillus daejeonensis TaxID=135193 RepID=UPI000372B89E|nr:ImmA/IrrE family metallo-endopeptidase [Paenibacillus daejeonensis]
MEFSRVIRRLLRKYKTNDPFILAEYLNIEVWFMDLGTSTRGMFRRTMRRKYIIIHEGLDEYWRRFICAHELAHAILHPGINRFWLDENSLFCKGRYEREASMFAVELLIANDPVLTGESFLDVLQRNHVPVEMHSFYL